MLYMYQERNKLDLIWFEIGDFFFRATLKSNGWPRKTIGHLFYAAFSSVHQSIAISVFKLELQSGNTQFGSKSMFFVLHMRPWNLTGDLEKEYVTLLCYFKLCASFCSHRWIQTGVTVRTRSIRVKIGDFFFCATLKSNGWPRKTIGHLFYATFSSVHHSIAISVFNLELQSGNTQFGSKSMFFVLHMRPWNLAGDLEK